MHRSISIKEIARIARVSHSTVSRALRGSVRVSAETTRLIRQIADENGYHPSLAARSLVTRKSQTIGCVVTSLADPFVGGVISGIEEEANRHGYSVFLANSNGDPERELAVVRSFRERRVDGVLVAASQVGASYIPHLSTMQIPLVLINNLHPGDFVNSVMIENIEAAKLITGHLIELGHRKIAYIGDRSGQQSDRERYSGFTQSLAMAGIRENPAWVVYGSTGPEGGEAQMRHLLQLPERPTAVFCYDDLIALGAFKAVHDAGLDIPSDISLTGFDDLFVASYTHPPLTTVHQPLQAMGKRAMQVLLELLTRPQKEARGENWHVRIRGELVIRQSTAKPKEAI